MSGTPETKYLRLFTKNNCTYIKLMINKFLQLLHLNRKFTMEKLKSYIFVVKYYNGAI